MADRAHRSLSNSVNPSQQLHFPRPPAPQSQQPNSRGYPLTPPDHHPAWKDTPSRHASYRDQPDDFAIKSLQMQGSVRGPAPFQYHQGRSTQQHEQHAGQHKQCANLTGSTFDSQANYAQTSMGAPMSLRLQTNLRTTVHEDMNKKDASHHRKMPNREDAIRVRQPGHGSQSTNVFVSASPQPPYDQARAFPMPPAEPVGSNERGWASANQQTGFPGRITQAGFQGNMNSSYNRMLRPDDTDIGFHSQVYANPTDPSMRGKSNTNHRAETNHSREAPRYYEDSSTSASDMNSIAPSSFQEQFERLTISNTWGVDSSRRTEQSTTTNINPAKRVPRQDVQKEAHGNSLDRICTRYPYDVDLARYLTREGDYAVAGGGCADVYKGTLSIDKTAIKVAIKVIKVYASDENMSKKQQRLLHEIEVWKKLNHDNILQLLGTTSGLGESKFLLPSMVCPWLENGTLTSYLERPGVVLEITRILRLIYEVASGLHYLHSKSIVHGDLSGSNVLIHADGKACIADFGLSKILYEGVVSTSVLSSTGKLRGTLRWAAPELLYLQDDKEAKNPTTQSDVYSFGGIMLQILSREVPYCYLLRDAQVVTAISKMETPKRPSSPHVTDRRWNFIQRCWSPFQSVEQRPSSGEIVAFSKDDLVGKDVQELATGGIRGTQYHTS